MALSRGRSVEGVIETRKTGRQSVTLDLEEGADDEEDDPNGDGGNTESSVSIRLRPSKAIFEKHVSANFLFEESVVERRSRVSGVMTRFNEGLLDVAPRQFNEPEPSVERQPTAPLQRKTSNIRFRPAAGVDRARSRGSAIGRASKLLDQDRRGSVAAAAPAAAPAAASTQFV